MSFVHSRISRCYRLVIPDPVNSFNIPNDVSNVILRNDGANDIKISFDDDATEDYFTLKAGATLPVDVSVLGGKTLNTDGIGGASILEIIAWG